jgi:hypothetical protein
VDWNMTLAEGVVVGLHCPQCQTPEESAEAEVNAATLTYELSADGKIGGYPRLAPDAASRLIEVEGWGEVAWLREPVNGPLSIIPPFVFVYGELRQGVDLLRAITESGVAMRVPRVELTTEAQMARLEHDIAKLSDNLGGLRVEWDWEDDPAEGDGLGAER